MPFDYEALVGHLYIVGGRAISAAPPGTLVEVAPKKAARGREADTFFVMVLPAGQVIAPAAFYEQMCQVSAERYFGSSGSVTAGLRTILNSINDDLYAHNNAETARYDASIVCAVLRGGDLYLARVGAGVALLCHNGELQPFPSDFAAREVLAGAALGSGPTPDIKMAHYEVANGTRLVLSDPKLTELEMTRLSDALTADDIAGVLIALKDLVLGQGVMMVAEFVPPETASHLTAHEGESTETLVATTDEPGPKRRAPGPLEAPVRGTVAKGALAAAGLARASGYVLDKVTPTPKEPADSSGKSRLSSPMAAGAAVFVPVVVVVLVIILWLTGAGESEFEQCVGEANSAANVARNVSSSDVAGVLAGWNAVLSMVSRCEEMRSGDAALASLSYEGREIIDRLLQIERRPMRLVTSFPNAGLTRVVLQGEDLYALDNTNDLVYRIKIGEDGLSLVPGSQQPISSMRRNASVAEFTVGDILDIAWAQSGGGLPQPNVLVALDANGILIACPPRFLETMSCSAQRLLNTDTWVQPAAIGFYQARLYILDPDANQIWRYEPGAGAYTNAPTEYFVGSGRPDIRQAIDLGITDAGEIFLLYADGGIKKFVNGQESPFGYAGFPDGQQITGAEAMFLNRNPIAQGLLVVNRAQRTIYETTLGGTFIAAYRPQDEAMFTTVADAVVDDARRVVYAVSGNAVLAFNRGN